MKNVMIDLETMGKNADAAIIAIGAVEFDIQSAAVGERFYTIVDLESSVNMGGVIDPSTVLWWMQQSDAARAEFTRGGEHITVALYQFSKWMMDRAEKSDVKVWGNGADFDNVILSSAFMRNKTTRPWEFWNNRCYRTVKAMYPQVKILINGTHHNAVDDAENQAWHLINMLKTA